MSDFDDVPINIDFDQIEQVAQVFFEESKEILSGLDSLILNLEAHPDDVAVLNHLFRQIHTLKGSVGAVQGGQLLGSVAHEFEALLSKFKKEQVSINKDSIDIFLHSSKILKILAEALRVKSDILPEVLSEVIELITRFGQFDLRSEKQSEKQTDVKPVNRAQDPVRKEEDGIWLTQTQIAEMLKVSGEILVLKNHFQYMIQTPGSQAASLEFGQELAKISDHLQNQMSKVLKVSGEECFKSLPALVRQAATELNKEISFEMSGLDILIDKNLGRDLNEILTHLLRNSLDHGIEDHFDRATAGKAPTGKVHFQISEKSDFIKMSLKDDGRGLDRERILKKAIEKNLCSSEGAASLSDAEVFHFIFHPGFSTKEKVTTISGRGVGMDVVNAVVQKYHGKIRIETKPNEGTEFLIEFSTPQHLAMESTILCEWQSWQLAVPLANVLQIRSCSDLQLTEVDSMRFCQWNQLTVPLMDYQEICTMKMTDKLNSSPDELENSSVLFIKHQHLIVGLKVDSIRGQMDMMVKPFGRFIQRMPGMRGTTVLAGEQIAYVIDPEKLMQLLKVSLSATAPVESSRAAA